jgi:hypothetical protein
MSVLEDMNIFGPFANALYSSLAVLLPSFYDL